MSLNRQTGVLIVIGLVVFIAVTIGTYNSFTKPFPGHNDFMSRWEGARSYWVDSLNPYGDEASLNIQKAIYGRAVIEGEDPGLFAYPMYMAFMVYPLVQMDYSWASAIWMTLLEACLIFALLLAMDMFNWRPKPLLLGALILWTLLAYYPARGLLLGQPGLLVYFLDVLAIWAIIKRHDNVAGIALAFSTIKPQMGFLIVPFLLLWALRVKRWRFVAVFVVTMLVLMGLSFLLVPTWMSDWIAQIALYPSYTEIGSPVWIVAHFPWLGINPDTGKWGISGGFGGTIELVINLALYAFTLWLWFTVLIQRKYERALWVAMLTILITHLVAPRTATPHYVVFITSMIFYLWRLNQPRIKRGGLWIGLLLLASFIYPWVHFALTVKGDFEHPTVYVPIPFLVLIVLWVTRRMWWQYAPLMSEGIA